MRFVDVAADEPTTALLLREYFDERVDGFPDPKGYATTVPDAARFVPPVGAFLRLDDPEPIGCGGVRRIEPDEHGDRFEIKHLYLRPSARGRGAGGALLDELERRAALLGAATVVLDTNASLRAAAGLYASRGYARIAPYNDNPNATDWYGKPVDPRPATTSTAADGDEGTGRASAAER